MDESDVPTTAELVGRRSRAPGGLAIAEGATDRGVTWGQLESTVTDWATQATRLGSDEGLLVGLLIADPLLMAGCVLAALANHVAVAPLDPAATVTQLADQIRVLGLSAVVADDRTANVAAQLAEQVAVWTVSSDGLTSRTRPRHRRDRRSPTEAAIVLASSGTTGTPKVVPLTERQLLRTAAGIATHHRLGPDDRCYCPLPLHHVNALVVGVVSTLVSGGSLVLDSRFSARAFWPTVRRHQASWLNLVPSILAVLGRTPAPPPGAGAPIRFARSASAPLAMPVRQRFEALSGIAILETYGMTEAASQITANPLGDDRCRPGSVGRPVDIEVRIVDDDGVTDAGPGNLGAVQIRGERVVACYWAPATDPAPPRRATNADGWLDTGDLGHVETDGSLHLAGRADDVINRGGEKVHPREIEEVLAGDPAVGVAIVVGVPDPVLGERPVALVIADPVHDRAGLAARLERRCAERLSRFKLPGEIIVVEQLPVGTTGKVRRGDARELARVMVGPS